MWNRYLKKDKNNLTKNVIRDSSKILGLIDIIKKIIKKICT